MTTKQQLQDLYVELQTWVDAENARVTKVTEWLKRIKASEAIPVADLLTTIEEKVDTDLADLLGE